MPGVRVDVKMNGAGNYHLAWQINPPVDNGFLRHTDKETGVPDWWKPFKVEFSFSYPQP
jgi:periplasmic iron binding protein